MTRLLAALVAAPTLLALATPATAEPAPPTRFSVEVTGEGPDVILIPGLSTPRDVWLPTAERLKSHYRLHLLQVKGFGEDAGANAEGPVLRPLVDELGDYIATNRLENPAIVGHSMGGLAALMLAADHPELTMRIMVVDALPFIGVLFYPGATAENIEPQAAAPATPRDCSAIVETGTPPPGNMTNTLKGACMVGNWSAAADPRVVGQAAYDDLTTDMRPRLAGITAPVTVVYGQDARLLPVERIDAVYAENYATIPQARLVGVPESYHFVMLDQPARFEAALKDFLAR
jgi:pimeloyl-[acyl-carrier protein] methyl ester esterase